MGSKRKTRNFYLARKPQTRPSPRKPAPKKELPRVPLTPAAIEGFGGINEAKRLVSELLGYEVEVYETANNVGGQTEIPLFLLNSMPLDGDTN
jgi:hypothetical protein